MSTLNVNTINAATSGQAVAVDVKNPRSFRNLIINGSMICAQRGTSSTISGYGSVDRFKCSYSGEDEDPTQAQVDVASGTTPYTLGFRKAFKITNGNQTSTGGSDFTVLAYNIEAQDIANSGWNYIDSNSKLTIQFWAKSSVAKTFILSLYAADGTPRQYNHKFTLAANTWTKVTHTIPGSSTLVFDNNNGTGIGIEIFQYVGTNLTSGSTVDQWVTYVGSSSTPDDTDDWWTTNDATFELTGVQLEVGDVATDFEHRSYGDELARCQRYYYKKPINTYGPPAYQYHNNHKQSVVFFPTIMRATPTCVATWAQSGTFTHYYNSASHFKAYIGSAYDSGNSYYLTSLTATAEL
tara:strand:- start:312 stop:1367 length:1056 start_codon:yes stop_codon:yes gene_type:complete